MKDFLTRQTLAEFLGMTPEDLGEFGVAPENRAALAAEPVEPDNMVAPVPGEESLDAFEWGRMIGIWTERYSIADPLRLAIAIQNRLGRRFWDLWIL